jgi:predicted RNA-binding Zn ribbon-like protein
MDFLGYAERAADLVNARLDSEDDLRALLQDRPWLADRITGSDLRALRRVQDELRPAFEGLADRPNEAVRLLNELLARHPIFASITNHDGSGWHLHVAHTGSSVAETLTAEALLGLAATVCELGTRSFGVCSAHRCARVFVDTSPNQSRRYCSHRCSSRANVAAFRARRRAAATR